VPLIFMHYPKGTFSQAALISLADEITTIGLDCEKLPNTAFVRSTTWIYANELPPSSVFVGGRPRGIEDADTKVISIEVNVFEGGLGDAAMQALIERMTDTVRVHASTAPGQPTPVYILIREVAPTHWGVFGRRITLEALRNPPVDAEPL
jgi:phenylpyruvate tautomerase PptA (4-oxalocrotonate tautomerase family)